MYSQPITTATLSAFVLKAAIFRYYRELKGYEGREYDYGCQQYIDVPGDRLSDQQGERYRIEDFLGSGGFGIAYRATDLRDNKEVAIKILQPRVAASSESAELFAREAEAAQQVSHKNIARTLAYVSLGASGIGVPYMVIEYIAGGNLADCIAAQNNIHFDQDVVIGWMMQLAEGLQAVHKHVLHRDLKPQNILVDGNTLKICDFGMSKYIEESTRTLTLKA